MTNKQLTKLITDGMKLSTLNEVNQCIDKVYMNEETYAHEAIIDSQMMDDLLNYQTDLETA